MFLALVFLLWVWGGTLLTKLYPGIEVRRYKAWHVRAVNDTKMAVMEEQMRRGAIEKWQLASLHLTSSPVALET